MSDHQRTTAVGEDLAKRADLADRFEPAGLDNGQRLVEPDGLALLEGLDVDVRRACQAHLAARGEHLDVVIVGDCQQNPVAAGRLPQPVDLFAQREKLLAGLLESFHQLGVSRRERVDAGLELMHVTGTARTALSPGGVLELLAQDRSLPAQLLQLGSIVAGHGRSEALGTL